MHEYPVGHLIVEFHVAFFQLQMNVLLNALHQLHNVHNLARPHQIGSVVNTVERRDVAQERREPLRLCIATVYKLLLCCFGCLRIVDQRLQISLYTCHRGLQFMGNILCQLSFQYILLFLSGLQALIQFDDSFCNLAQFIIGKFNQVFRIYSLVVVHTFGESSQVGNILSQPMDETIKHPRQQNDSKQRKPQEVAVGRELAHDIIVVRNGRPHNEMNLRNIGSRIEIGATRGRTISIHRVSQSGAEGLSHFRTALVIGEFSVIFPFRIEDHTAIRLNQRDAHPLETPAVDIGLQG